MRPLIAAAFFGFVAALAGAQSRVGCGPAASGCGPAGVLGAGATTTTTIPTGTLIVSDNFESYATTGVFVGAPWLNTTNVAVWSTPVHSGTRSIGIGQGGNTANAQLPLGTTLTKWILDCWLNVNSSSGTTGQFVGLRLAAANGIVINVSNAGAGRVLQDGGTVFFTFTATLNVWQHYILTVSQAAAGGTVALTLDGTSAGTFTGDTRDSSGNATVDRVYVVTAFIGPSPTGQIYMDDLFVYNNG